MSVVFGGRAFGVESVVLLDQPLTPRCPLLLPDTARLFKGATPEEEGVKFL